MKSFELISSPQNSQIQLLKKLALKKYRYQESKFTIENLVIIFDALQSGFDFEALFVTQSFVDKHQDKFNYLLDKSKIPKYYLIDEKLNKYYSQLETPSGITAIYNMSSRKIEKDEPLIYLNSINDPGNIGTIIRSSLAFGFKNIIFDENCADLYNFKTISASKDAIFKINFLEDKELTWLKKNKDKIAIYSSSSHDGKLLERFKAEKIFCLVLGSESHGVDERIIKLAKENIKIEMDENMESLNVASAAAILLYKLKQLKNDEIKKRK